MSELGAGFLILRAARAALVFSRTVPRDGHRAVVPEEPPSSRPATREPRLLQPGLSPCYGACGRREFTDADEAVVGGRVCAAPTPSDTDDPPRARWN